MIISQTFYLYNFEKVGYLARLVLMRQISLMKLEGIGTLHRPFDMDPCVRERHLPAVPFNAVTRHFSQRRSDACISSNESLSSTTGIYFEFKVGKTRAKKRSQTQREKVCTTHFCDGFKFFKRASLLLFFYFTLNFQDNNYRILRAISFSSTVTADLCS